jgi:hypothetical protein
MPRRGSVGILYIPTAIFASKQTTREFEAHNPLSVLNTFTIGPFLAYSSQGNFVAHRGKPPGGRRELF